MNVEILGTTASWQSVDPGKLLIVRIGGGEIYFATKCIPDENVDQNLVLIYPITNSKEDYPINVNPLKYHPRICIDTTDHYAIVPHFGPDDTLHIDSSDGLNKAVGGIAINDTGCHLLFKWQRLGGFIYKALNLSTGQVGEAKFYDELIIRNWSFSPRSNVDGRPSIPFVRVNSTDQHK